MSAQLCPTLCRPHGLQPHQAPLPMEFSRQGYWSGLPFPPPGDLPNPGIKSTSSVSPAMAVGFFTTNAIWEAYIYIHTHTYRLSLEGYTRNC